MSKRKSDGWISQRRDGRWNVGYGGKRTVRPTRSAALECLREMRVKGNKEKPPSFKGTLGSCVSWWMQRVLQNSVKPTTLTMYDSALRALIAQPVGTEGVTLGEMQMRAVKTSDLQKAVRKFSEGCDGACTMQRALSALSRCYKHYIAEGLLTKNPCEGVVVPETKKRQLVVDNLAYNGNEMRAIISEAKRRTAAGTYAHKYWYVYLLLANTGMRVGELLYLKWENVNLHDRTIIVEGNRVRVRDLETGKTIDVEQNTAKTATSTRVIPINAAAMQVLNELVETRNSATGHVVLSTKGKPVDAPKITRSFYSLLRRCGVEKKKRHGVHSLRHTFATRLIEQGTPIKIVSELLGHSSTAVTLDIYVHHSPGDLLNAVESIV